MRFTTSVYLGQKGEYKVMSEKIKEGIEETKIRRKKREQRDSRRAPPFARHTLVVISIGHCGRFSGIPPNSMFPVDLPCPQSPAESPSSYFSLLPKVAILGLGPTATYDFTKPNGNSRESGEAFAHGGIFLIV